VRDIEKLGVAICEFPINIETAQEAKRRHMVTVFGAPNLLRGESQNNSMRTIDAIRG
jgi:alpha-D-ribose 1-methylphosphonate 5-triphosphate diphosphatase